MLSLRSDFDLTPNALAVALARARAEGRAILDLTESNPTRAGIPYDERAILDALRCPAALTYEPAPFGLPHAREAVARELGVDPTRVVLTASTSEAYAFLFKLLCDPGDEVLVPRPSYPLFDHLARLEGVTSSPYRLAYDGAWHVDLDSVRECAARPWARAVVVVAPNNPTGSYLSHAELDAIALLGLPIVSDEVFARYPLREGAARVTTALEARGASLVFALGGLSKLAALPQMKLGWIVVGGDDTACVTRALARLEVIADAFLSVGAPVQHALPALLASHGATAGAISARTRSNLAALREEAAGSGVTVLDVEGGWYATLRLPGTRTEEEWVQALLERDGVYVHPGHFFDFEDEPHLVVSLLTPEEPLREGARRIVERTGTR
jgi:alanine-synthesizing transaminase